MQLQNPFWHVQVFLHQLPYSHTCPGLGQGAPDGSAGGQAPAGGAHTLPSMQ